MPILGIPYCEKPQSSQAMGEGRFVVRNCLLLRAWRTENAVARSHYFVNIGHGTGAHCIYNGSAAAISLPLPPTRMSAEPPQKTTLPHAARSQKSSEEEKGANWFEAYFHKVNKLAGMFILVAFGLVCVAWQVGSG